MVGSHPLRQAAVLLTSLPDREAVDLLRRLTPQQARKVALEIPRLGNVGPQDREMARQEFIAACQPTVCTREESAQVDRRPFALLRRCSAEELVALLADERPQTMAMIAAHLPRDLAVQFVGRLAGSLQAQVIRGIAALATVQPEVVGDVEAALARPVAEVHRQWFQPTLEKRSA